MLEKKLLDIYLKKNEKAEIVKKDDIMKKNILVVDDSALMRRVICDIINSDKKTQAKGGERAFDLPKNLYR